MEKEFTPIALFTYARQLHVRKTVEALLRNPEAEQHDLIVFSDAARSQEDEVAVKEVRSYLSTIKGFRSVTIYHRAYNFGLAKSIIEGVTEILENHDSVIVLEDDIVTSPYFLTYMNDALKRFKNDDRVISIHGYVYPTKEKLPEAFFMKGADCWGWATWKRGWDFFNPNGEMLIKELERRGLIKEFDFNGAYSFSKMLRNQIQGKNDSWAVRWHASAFLAGKLTLYPGRSLVHNIGNDSTGSHCGSSSIWDVSLSSTPVDLFDCEVIASDLGYKAFERYFWAATSFKSRLFDKVRLAFVKRKK